jgi:sodium/potassium-transporting ATPase subunit alpha
VSGDASETAILRFMEVQFKNVKKYRLKHKILCEIPFNSRTKYQVFVHEISEKNQPVHLVSIKVRNI